MSDRAWHYTRGGPKPWRCGAMTGDATSVPNFTTCEDCLELIKTGGSEDRPHHVPPVMNESGDGVFLFTDTHHGAGFTMEVVPQTTGNVEITLDNPQSPGHMFTLSHLDRMDLVRALLHDFHYSPERGGPNGDD